VLRDARQAAGRSVETGAVEPDRAHLAGNRLGAVGHMMMFDQVGSAYQLAGSPPEQGPSFVKALKSFAAGVGELEERPSAAPSPTPSAWSTSVRPSGLTTSCWTTWSSSGRSSGFCRNRGTDSSTIAVCPTRPGSLGDSAEEVFTRLVDLHEQNGLAIALPGGLAELQRRYAMTVRPGLRMVEP
jgi:hypothetical protein